MVLRSQNKRTKRNLTVLLAAVSLLASMRLAAVEIPLDTITPVRIGYVDLQRVFDTYPEKSFAEGDLLREIEKRKRELGRRQTQINTLRQQITADQAALAQAKTGQAIIVPVNNVPAPVPEPVAAPAPKVSSATVTQSTAPAKIEPYPTEDPLAGLPGHEGGGLAPSGAPSGGLPGMEANKGPAPTALDLLAAATGPVLLTPEAASALQKRIDDNHRALDKAVLDFKNFRTNAVGDMKQLQAQKTYGVMSKIYAVLQNLARDEGVTVVLDKAYVLYGEDSVDLSEKLIDRLQVEQ